MRKSKYTKEMYSKEVTDWETKHNNQKFIEVNK